MRGTYQEMLMARTHKRETPNPWIPADVKTLRALAGKRFARTSARALKRTEGAVRQKALALHISLRVR